MSRGPREVNATAFRAELQHRQNVAGSQTQLAARLHVDRALISRTLDGHAPTPQLLAACGWELRAVPIDSSVMGDIVPPGTLALLDRLVSHVRPTA